MFTARRGLAAGLVITLTLALCLTFAATASGLGAAPVYLPHVARAATPTPTLSPTPTMPVPTPVPPTGEIRAVWVSRFDWTKVPNIPTVADIQAVVDDVARAGFNTIFFQVRGAGDAYYTPGLEPWAPRLTGSHSRTLGQHPGWDPLAEMIWRAHAAGIRVHAWTNVSPVWLGPPEVPDEPLTPNENLNDPPAPLYRLSWNNDRVQGYGLGNAWRAHDANGNPMGVVWGSYLWASPSVPAVRDHVAAVAADIAARYAIDGLHLDYVRYPGSQYSLDPTAQEACAADPACPGVEDEVWRGHYQRDRLTHLVAEVAARARAARPGLQVSAAVWPLFMNPMGLGDSALLGFYDYCQDGPRWLREGHVQYIAPMLYSYSMQAEHSEKGYEPARELWRATLADLQAHAPASGILPGIGVERGGGGYLPFDELAARIALAREMGAPGHAFFSLGGLREAGYLDALRAGPYAQPAAALH